MNIAQIFQFASGLAWMLAIVLAVVALSRVSRGQPAKGFGTSVLISGVVAAILTVVGAGLVFINPQERGVVISALDPKGYREQALQPGLRFVVPFAEQVVRYPISRQTYTMSISSADLDGGETVAARTSDGQQIFVDASVIYAIDPNQVVDVHIAWQNRYTEDLVRPQARGIIRDAVSQYGVEEVVSSKRFEMVELMRTT
ncbi:MAG: SPFH domain-containing protein, partial [Anaerolineales bacterium]